MTQKVFVADARAGHTIHTTAPRPTARAHHAPAHHPPGAAAPGLVAPASFAALPLAEPIRRALAELRYELPTPIQARAIPPLLDGRDLLACAPTGTGKTAAFALPILDRLARAPRPQSRSPRALILTPTRELAVQIDHSFARYGRHVGVRRGLVFGGVGQGPQVSALRNGVDVLVATPGRLIDLMEQGHAGLASVEVVVLDEGDRMLDMGFIAPIRRILRAVPAQRQTMLFSATMPPAIASLAASILRDPAEVHAAPVASPAEGVRQWVLFVDRAHKPALLREVLRDPTMTRVLVFTRTKHRANRVAGDLARQGIAADAIHGNKSQSARQRALAGFKDGRVRVLVATDVAARGLDIAGVSHVINFELPNEPESYVHRIGRTARAGATGVALAFCDAEERTALRDVERLMRKRLQVVDRHPYARPDPV
jgi:ATP-dependent RNA helicase RhlE